MPSTPRMPPHPPAPTSQNVGEPNLQVAGHEGVLSMLPGGRSHMLAQGLDHMLSGEVGAGVGLE